MRDPAGARWVVGEALAVALTRLAKASDAFGKATTGAFIMDKYCRVCDADLIGGHAPTCWLRPLLKEIREAHEQADLGLAAWQAVRLAKPPAVAAD